MNSWKLSLGLGAACAACCAIPILGAAGGVAALGSALWACAAQLWPVAGVLAVVAAGLIGVPWWRRRQLARRCVAGCASSCSLDAACDPSGERPAAAR